MYYFIASSSFHLKVIAIHYSEKILVKMINHTTKLQTKTKLCTLATHRLDLILCAGQIVLPPSPPGQPRGQRKYARDKKGRGTQKRVILVII